MNELSITLRGFKEDPLLVSNRLGGTQTEVRREGSRISPATGSVYRHSSVRLATELGEIPSADASIAEVIRQWGGFDNVASVIRAYNIEFVEIDIIVRMNTETGSSSYAVGPDVLAKLSHLGASMSFSASAD